MTAKTLIQTIVVVAILASCSNMTPSGDMTATNTPAGGGLEGGSNVGAVNLSLITTCTDAQLLKWDDTGAVWECANDETGGGGTGDIDSVTAGNGLTGGGTSGAVTLDVACGGGLTCNSNDVTLALTAQNCASGLFLDNVTATGVFGCVAELGDIESITAGTGLTGGGTSGTPTLDVGCVTNSLVCNADTVGLASRDFGDLTVGSSGTTMTVDNDAITYAKIQNMAGPGFMGRDDGTAGDVEYLTSGQATAILTQFSSVTTSSGIVPGANGCGSSCFLHADGTWSTSGLLNAGDGIEINSSQIEIRQDCSPLDVLQWRDPDNEGVQPLQWMCTDPSTL